MNNGEVSQGYVALPVQRQAAEVIATEYYNLNGIRMAGPAYQGITIVMEDIFRWSYQSGKNLY